jgi:hypothetical protein
MEVALTEQGTFELLWDKWDIFTSLLALGFSVALVVVVVVAGARLGWRFWPWVLGAGAIAWWLL